MIKEKLAEMIAGQMNDDQKRQVIQAFYDTHKQDKNIEDLIVQMKRAIGYTKDDVPKRI